MSTDASSLVGALQYTQIESRSKRFSVSGGGTGKCSKEERFDALNSIFNYKHCDRGQSAPMRTPASATAPPLVQPDQTICMSKL